MSWVAVGFDLEAGQAETVADALLETGALSVDVGDAAAGTAQEQALFGEPGAEPGQAWPFSRVVALFDPGADHGAIVAAALAAAGIERVPELTTVAVADQDWVRATQAQFGPIQISARLWIVPTWCEIPDPSAVNLRLDPGLAFGTGGHPTTWQCLRWLEAHLSPGARVLDYGCGSGVLAIAAKRLGAGHVVAVDIDAGALQASAANARANGTLIDVTEPDRLPPGPYDLVLANILSKPLRLLAPLLASLTPAGGQVVLAGVLSDQTTEVAADYAPWYEISIVSEKEGWACLLGTRKLP
jgi:ribosomal protein L11 methyltransferase